MRYLALVCDYDGTLATNGKVAENVLKALQNVRHSGRKLILLTGRELPDLRSVFPPIDIFDRIVAENGALLYQPATREEKLLAEPPPDVFFDALQKRHVEPLSRGRVIVASRHPQETIILEVIRKLGLELTVSFNKGAVMVLPSGVNKKTGLDAALEELVLSIHTTVGIGDAENDHTFLEVCERSAAVANALPALKEKVDIVMTHSHGEGVRELAEKLLSNDLADLGSIPISKML